MALKCKNAFFAFGVLGFRSCRNISVALRSLRTHFLGAGDTLAPLFGDNSLHMAMPLQPPLASPSCAQSNLASSAAASAAGITVKPKRRRREPSISKNVRQDVMRFARR